MTTRNDQLADSTRAARLVDYERRIHLLACHLAADRVKRIRAALAADESATLCETSELCHGDVLLVLDRIAEIVLGEKP